MTPPSAEHLTLLSQDDTNTLVVDDDEGRLLISVTAPGGERIMVVLDLKSAKRLRGRINRYVRENK